MYKNSFQDIIPPHKDGERRSIRNIPITRKSSKRGLSDDLEIRTDGNLAPDETLVEGYDISNSAPILKKIPNNNGNKKFLKSKFFFSLAVLAILIFAFVMLNAFTSASIEITPKKETISFNLSLKAVSGEDPVSTSTVSSLKYELIELVKEGQKEVAALGEEDVERKASGMIVIYNNFSSEPQRLITRTRFETAEGLIYRINESVTVPGKNASGPGYLETVVYAEEPGEKYNIDLKDFTVPGFKSDSARYKGFYARSKTEMQGGFVGKAKKISEDDKTKALKEIEASLKETLKKEIMSKIPEELLLLEGGIIYESKMLPQTDSEGSKALLKGEVRAYAAILNRTELASIIQSEFLKSWQNIKADLGSTEKISLNFENSSSNLKRKELISIKVSGTTEMKALIDSQMLAENIMGKQKSELGLLVESSPAIDSAKAIVRPIWKTSFPDNQSKIKIKIVE